MVKKKEEPGIFSDDDDFLGGLGIDEKGQSPRTVKPRAVTEDEESRPAKSAMDKLLGKDSGAARHLEAPKERREFVLDKKYTQPDQGM